MLGCRAGSIDAYSRAAVNEPDEPSKLCAFINWLEAKPFERQILLLALTLDPLGFILGYMLAPSVGVEPLMGGVYGLIAASLPLSFWVLRHSKKQ